LLIAALCSSSLHSQQVSKRNNTDIKKRLKQHKIDEKINDKKILVHSPLPTSPSNFYQKVLTPFLRMPAHKYTKHVKAPLLHSIGSYLRLGNKFKAYLHNLTCRTTQHTKIGLILLRRTTQFSLIHICWIV
jgi:hypothetical protein